MLQCIEQHSCSIILYEIYIFPIKKYNSEPEQSSIALYCSEFFMQDGIHDSP